MIKKTTRHLLRRSSKLLFSILAASLVSASSLFFIGCQSESQRNNVSEIQGDNKDYFPIKTDIKHAKGFQISYFKNYKIVKISNPFEKTTDSTKYLLLQRGTVRPAGFEDHHLIEIPIRRLAAMSSMHIGLLGFLDSFDVLTGLGDLRYVYAPQVLQLIKEGKIQEVGNGQRLNEEKLVSMQPDLIMEMGNPGAQMGHYETLNQANIPVLMNSEWVETTPLARAEWVKLLAALLNKEELVNSKFADIENEYNQLLELAKNAKSKPTIISGLNTKDTWFLPSGKSYMVRFFLDAGGQYHWSNTADVGSLALNFEAVYPVALNAEYWLNVGFGNNDTQKSILAQDSRYTDFSAYKAGKMYSYNNRVNAEGANDFFESGSMAPHTILADLIKILHPELLPEHQLVYYRQLPKE